MAKMDNEPTYRKAYDELSEELVADLSRVDSPETSQEFIEQAARRITAAHDTVPEFYIGEFFHKFQKRSTTQFNASFEQSKRAAQEVDYKFDQENMRLDALLEQAKQSGDEDAVHAVWKERESIQSEGQTTIDKQTEIIKFVQLQIETCQALATALKLHPKN